MLGESSINKIKTNIEIKKITIGRYYIIVLVHKYSYDF